jgi:SAM-dependent methyltransferase
MAQYQSFPDIAGDSHTLDKLKALHLPVLEGRSFLDVGCNEGFFCGFAKFAGATRVVGIDHNEEFVRRARMRFPGCEFRRQGWDALPQESFDVILLASALHYAEDQPALVRRLVERLTKGGVLVLELGVVRSDKAEWITVKRGIDQRLFPTMPMLAELLGDCAWKWMGPSVNQSGDPVPRHVVHVSRRRPVAYLMMQPPAFGKSSIAKRLFVPAGVRVISGDAVLLRIAQGGMAVPERLHDVVAAKYSALAADETVHRVFGKNLGPLLVRAWLLDAGDGDIAIDGFVPAKYHEEAARELESAGYLPVVMNWERATHSLMSQQSLDGQADAFYRTLSRNGLPPPPKATREERPPPAGYVDAVSVIPAGVTIRGWALDESGAFPKQLVVGIGTERIILDIGEALPRKDVQRHLDWQHAQLGFSLTLADGKIRTLADLGSRGFSVSLISGRPLGLSTAAAHALRGEAR